MRKLMGLDENIDETVDETVDDLMTSNGFIFLGQPPFPQQLHGAQRCLRFISAEPENPGFIRGIHGIIIKGFCRDVV